jgi:hypothetical protein
MLIINLFVQFNLKKSHVVQTASTTIESNDNLQVGDSRQNAGKDEEIQIVDENVQL